MLILCQKASAKTQVKNSVFLAEADWVSSPDEAREIWRERKRTYDNGGHIVYAFICGPQGNVAGCSDDGEPSGTAGRPVLEVLRGSGLTDVLLTVTRWFGGTKLGTGGLVKAYTGCAQLALQDAVTEELISRCTVEIEVAYGVYETIRRHLCDYEAEVAGEGFADAVSLTLRLPSSRRKELEKYLLDLTGGKAVIKSGETLL